MKFPSRAFLMICVIVSVDAAYKSEKTRDNYQDALHKKQGAGAFQPFLLPSDINHNEKQLFDVDFKSRNGHGHTNQRGTDEFECPKACTMDLRPVCGSDGQSYSNRCELMATACRQRKRVYVEKEGRC